MAIDVEAELSRAEAHLPITLHDTVLPIDIQLRTIALTLAQRHVGDTCVKEGNLYQQLKMDNKLGHAVSLDDVVKTALVFERYLWGEWSKGIAENAINATQTELADVLEKKFREATDGAPDDSPVRPSQGSEL